MKIKKYDDFRLLKEEDEYDEDEYDELHSQSSNKIDINKHTLKIKDLKDIINQLDDNTKDVFFMVDGTLKFPMNLIEKNDGIHFNLSRMPKYIDDDDEEI